MDELLKLKIRVIKNRLVGLKNESIFKICFVLFFAAGLLWGIYRLSLELFFLLDNIEALSKILIDRLIYLFFFSLFFMLVLSSAVWGYVTLYKTKEVDFLFTLPLEHKKIFVIKFIEAVILAGWAFLFLSFPFMSAYGYFRHLSWSFYLYLALMIIPLFFLSGSLGVLFSITAVRFFPQKRRQVIFISLFLAAVCFFLFRKYSRAVPAGDESVSFFLTRFFPYIKLSQNKFLPSLWAAEGLMQFSFFRFREGIFWLGLLISNALFWNMVCFDIAGVTFYPGWEKQAALSHLKKTASNRLISWLGKLAGQLVSPSMGALVRKDLLIFRRSPEQNLQFLFFFGLLGFYFANLRNLSYHTFIPKWKAIVLMLNILATQLTLGSFVIRFIFPQISMEGRRFWILGLSPLSRRIILREKFFLSVFIALGVTLSLTLVSGLTLKAEGLYIWISILVTIISSLTITSISCGLGAVFADFKEDNPAVIVSGFGGTFTLVLTLFHIALTVFLVAPPFYLYLTGAIQGELFRRKIIFSGLLLVLFSLLISLSCLYLGKRKLESAEF